MTTATHRSRWDCHAHRDELRVSDEATVYHPEQGQLCYGERHYDGTLFYPLRFKDKAAAYRWIERGTIAEVQESLSVLAVGFVTCCFEPRKSEIWE